MAGAGLYAEKSADSRNEDDHAERGSANSEKIEREQAVPRLNDGRNAREYVDEADDASDLFIFAFSHFYFLFFILFCVIKRIRDRDICVGQPAQFKRSCA